MLQASTTFGLMHPMLLVNMPCLFDVYTNWACAKIYLQKRIHTILIYSGGFSELYAQELKKIAALTLNVNSKCIFTRPKKNLEENKKYLKNLRLEKNTAYIVHVMWMVNSKCMFIVYTGKSAPARIHTSMAVVSEKLSHIVKT